MTTLALLPPQTVSEPDGQVSELFELPTNEATLLRLFKLLFEEHAGEIVFDPCIAGAVFEIQMPGPAELTMLDGYLTVNFGPWHFHLWIGPHRGTTASPCPPELARHRQVDRAALFRSRNKSCVPASWGLRLWNGAGEQMITVFFRNPYRDEQGHRRREPDWSRLHVWDRVRREFLELAADPCDREKGVP